MANALGLAQGCVVVYSRVISHPNKGNKMFNLGPLTTENMHLHLAARSIEAGIPKEEVVEMFKALTIMGKNIAAK